MLNITQKYNIGLYQRVISISTFLNYKFKLCVNEIGKLQLQNRILTSYLYEGKYLVSGFCGLLHCKKVGIPDTRI